MSCDLEKAFLQILVKDSDRDVTRILWPDDPVKEDEPKIYRFTRVAFGLGPAPFLLGATVEHHLEQSASPWAPKLMRGSYVDNYLFSVDEPAQISSAAREIRDLFWQAGFNCRQFLSNARDEVSKLPSEWQETKTQVSLLGVQWDTITDEFILRLPSMDVGSELTKRSILSHVASVYDPCGLISPALLPAKNVKAKIWASETSAKWDDPINELLGMEFLKVLATWENVVYRFPRKNFSPTFSSNCSVQLHGFSDASQKGLGFAIYARFANEDSFESSLIFARSLVVPTALRPKPTKKGLVREISIPRLELQATSLLAKAISQLKEFLQTPVETIQLWTDSSTVVQWLKLKETKEVFVRNRLPIIRNYCVNHVSTNENSADLASHGVEPYKLRGLQLWWNGPSWLIKPDETWPKAEFTYRPGD